MKLMEVMESKNVRHVSVDTVVQEVIKLVNQQHSPVMVVMVGLPASGKSTFINKLNTELEKTEKLFTVVGTDLIIDKYAKDKGINYTDAYREIDHKEVEKFYKDSLKQCINDRDSFIIDRTHMAKKNRHPHLVNASEHLKIAVAFEIDPAVQEKRLKDRASQTGKWIPQNVIDSMKNDYEPPSQEEGFDYVFFIS